MNIAKNPAINGERLTVAVENPATKQPISKDHQGKYTCATVATVPMMITLGINHLFALRREAVDIYDPFVLFIRF